MTSKNKSSKEQAKEADSKKSSFLARTAATLTLVLLLLSSYYIVSSFWVSPFESDGLRFVYQNTAVTASIISIVIVMILSAAQKDVFWPTKRKSLKLDERELAERNIVLEKSYRICALMSLFVAWFIASYGNNLPAIIELNGGSVPGHLYWLAANFAVAVYAIPLAVAAYRK